MNKIIKQKWFILCIAIVLVISAFIGMNFNVLNKIKATPEQGVQKFDDGPLGEKIIDFKCGDLSGYGNGCLAITVDHEIYSFQTGNSILPVKLKDPQTSKPLKVKRFWSMNYSGNGLIQTTNDKLYAIGDWLTSSTTTFLDKVSADYTNAVEVNLTIKGLKITDIKDIDLSITNHIAAMVVLTNDGKVYSTQPLGSIQDPDTKQILKAYEDIDIGKIVKIYNGRGSYHLINDKGELFIYVIQDNHLRKIKEKGGNYVSNIDEIYATGSHIDDGSGMIAVSYRDGKVYTNMANVEAGECIEFDTLHKEKYPDSESYIPEVKQMLLASRKEMENYNNGREKKFGFGGGPLFIDQKTNKIKLIWLQNNTSGLHANSDTINWSKGAGSNIVMFDPFSLDKLISGNAFLEKIPEDYQGAKMTYVRGYYMEPYNSSSTEYFILSKNGGLFYYKAGGTNNRNGGGRIPFGSIDINAYKPKANNERYNSNEKYNNDVYMQPSKLGDSFPNNSIKYVMNDAMNSAQSISNEVEYDGQVIQNIVEEGKPVLRTYTFWIDTQKDISEANITLDLYKKSLTIDDLPNSEVKIEKGQGIQLGDNGFAKAGGKTSNAVSAFLIGPGNTQTKEKYVSGTPITQLGQYTLEAIDEHGNANRFTFTVIDKEDTSKPNPDQGGGGGEENKPKPPLPDNSGDSNNEKPSLPKPDKGHCVPGIDQNYGNQDDVCGNGNGKEEPTKDEEGNIHIPSGGSVKFPDKELPTPDGAIIYPDGSVTLPDGSEYDPEGNLKPKPTPPEKPNTNEGNDKPSKPNNPNCVVGPDGKPGTADDVCGTGSGNATPKPQEDGSVVIPPKGDGGAIFPGGTVVPLPDGGTINPDGTITIPNGSNKPDRNDCVAGPDGILGTADDVCGIGTPDKKPNKKPDGSIEVPPGGAIVFPDKIIQVPDGAIIHPDGSVTLPDGSELDANGNKKPSKQNHSSNDTTLSGGSNTGDSTNWLWWVVLMVLSSGVFIGNLLQKNKK